jgi:hypothetical protein
MTISECVVDSELFKKVSSNNSRYQSFMELLLDMRSNPQFTQDDENECKCFYHLLRSIKNYKCKLVYNEKIIIDYNQIIEMCPEDIITILGRILSETACYTKKEEKLHHTHRLKLYNSPLKNKIPYVDAAHLCDNNKLIVSTVVYLNSKYKNCRVDLNIVGVICENACYVINHVN